MVCKTRSLGKTSVNNDQPYFPKEVGIWSIYRRRQVLRDGLVGEGACPKSDHLNSIPGVHTVKGENLQAVLTSTYSPWHVYI